MRISKDESGLKSDFVKGIKEHLKGAVVLRHEDIRTSGIPDLSITFNGLTSWWEAKHATPNFASSGIQELTMLRLNAQGYARYIIWYESAASPKLTLIVGPQNLGEYKSMVGFGFKGFNTEEVYEHIRRVHMEKQR